MNMSCPENLVNLNLVRWVRVIGILSTLAMPSSVAWAHGADEVNHNTDGNFTITASAQLSHPMHEQSYSSTSHVPFYSSAGHKIVLQHSGSVGASLNYQYTMKLTFDGGSVIIKRAPPGSWVTWSAAAEDEVSIPANLSSTRQVSVGDWKASAYTEVFTSNSVGALAEHFHDFVVTLF
jgi:hypothetical protein